MYTVRIRSLFSVVCSTRMGLSPLLRPHMEHMSGLHCEVVLILMLKVFRVSQYRNSLGNSGSHYRGGFLQVGFSCIVMMLCNSPGVDLWLVICLCR